MTQPKDKKCTGTKELFDDAWKASLFTLMKVKEESEKADLKLNIQKTKIMASGPITLWQIDGETMGTVRDFILLGSKTLQMVTATMKLKDTCSLGEKLWPTQTAY